MKNIILHVLLLILLICTGRNLHASEVVSNSCRISQKISPTLPFKSLAVSSTITDLYEANRELWSPQDLRLVGGCYVARKEYGKALNVYRELLLEFGTNAWLVTSIGEIHQLNKDFANAELMYAQGWNEFHDPIALSLWARLKLEMSGARGLTSLLPDLMKHQGDNEAIREVLIVYVLTTDNIESAQDVFLSVVSSVKGREVKQNQRLAELLVFATARLEKELNLHDGAEDKVLRNGGLETLCQGCITNDVSSSTLDKGGGETPSVIDISGGDKNVASIVQKPTSSFSFRNSALNKAIIGVFEKKPEIWYPKDIEFIIQCHLAENEYKKALDLWRERLRLDPSNVSLVIGMGGLYQLNGDLINAESMYAKGWNEFGDPSALSQLSILRLRTNGVSGLTPLLPSLLAQQTHDSDIQRVLLAYCLMTEDVESAKEIYHSVEKNLNEDSVQGNKELHRILAKIKAKLDGAAELHGGTAGDQRLP